MPVPTTPPQLADRAAPTNMSFVVGQTSLGTVLVAATSAGVAAVMIGDDADQLSHELSKRFANAVITADSEDPAGLAARVIAIVESPRTHSAALEIPMDLRGTRFQQSVWQALRRIPTGSTSTYSRIAEQVGMPSAARAVAGACAANPLAVLVPCHRVLRSDGSLSGYRWGVERKRILLEREATVA